MIHFLFHFLCLVVCSQQAILQLQRSGLIECNARNEISTLPFGAIMSKYFLTISTMTAFSGVSIILKPLKILNFNNRRIFHNFFFYFSSSKIKTKFSGNASISDILDKIMYCTEFAEFYLRKNEKKLLNEINAGHCGKHIPYRIPSKITSLQHKVSW